MSEIAKRLRARADEQERCNSFPADRALDHEAAAEIDALREALRGLAVVGTVRLTLGSGIVPNGGLCKLCGAEWTTRRDDGSLISPEPREHHNPHCLLEDRK